MLRKFMNLGLVLWVKLGTIPSMTLPSLTIKGISV